MSWYLSVWKKYAVFSGRARRKEFWFFLLFHMIVFFVLSLVASFTGTPGEGGQPGEPGVLIFAVLAYMVASFIPALAVQIRRLHDTNRSGWWILISFIPVIGFIVLLVFFFTEGDADENKFGPSPKAVAA